ncbi:amidase family protein [Bradyrhizobium sp. USDA 4504]
MQDTLGAFVPGPIIQRGPNRSGPLSGLTFAVKDLFDVAGTVTGCGNPDWAATHEVEEADAWAVDHLLGAGAALTGKTITDEISLGLLGINKFYGTPLNPRAPDRVPGGSSSGSASAVAGGLVDIALGTDSGGSVRVPSCFCGLYGLRPTHGRISVAGMMTQAPSFDTVGYFARDATTFARVGAVLLGEQVPDALPTDIIIASDCFAIADAPVQGALQPVVDRLHQAAATIVSTPGRRRASRLGAASAHPAEMRIPGDLSRLGRPGEPAVLLGSRWRVCRRRPHATGRPRCGQGFSHERVEAARRSARRAARAVPAYVAHSADQPGRAPVGDPRCGARDRRPDRHRRPDRASSGESSRRDIRLYSSGAVSHRLARR